MLNISHISKSFNPGTPNEKLLARTEAIGQSWEPPTAQTEY